ncbi:hypothetical protein ELQ90_14325 [Labedella phragmitis]|uniref:Exo-alpha-sialidase n=1 Tax=Labedella phragmitis TaxID=2498849 RepID=A0A444PQE8_9MICO|nr:hypothetical protein [Labedella phragmitis]RWZ46608.1 hypothetical protein ELQ90_14325 [Labedella phragmitis]
MATSRRQSAARESRRPWWIFTALIVFLVVDVLLVVLALQSTAPRPPGPTTPRPSASSESTSTPSATPATDEDADADEDVEVASSITAAAPTRLLSALDDQVAWRATTGSCPDAPAMPQLTTDGGATWKSTDITASTDVRALQRILVTSADTASFIGATGEECDPEFVRTFVAGDDFAENTEQLDGTWHLSPVGSDTVHAPGGDVAAPCESAVVVSPLDDARAAVLCDDSSLHVTTDAGETWTRIDDTDGAVALTESEEGFLVALVGTSECDGARLAAFDSDGARTDVGCVQSPLGASELATATAIDWTADAIWAWVDDRLLISTDGGNTW